MANIETNKVDEGTVNSEVLVVHKKIVGALVEQLDRARRYETEERPSLRRPDLAKEIQATVRSMCGVMGYRWHPRGSEITDPELIQKAGVPYSSSKRYYAESDIIDTVPGVTEGFNSRVILSKSYIKTVE